MKESFINYYWFQYWHIIVFGELTMVYCHNCGKKLDEDTQYCTKCGHDLGHESSFEKNMENFGEKIGEKAEQFGRKIEKRLMILETILTIYMIGLSESQVNGMPSLLKSQDHLSAHLLP